MAEKQVILELDLGTDVVLNKSKELRTELEASRETLSKLKKEQGDNTEAIVKQEAVVKKLSQEYNNNQKVLQALVSTNGKAIPISEKVNLLLNEENTTRAKAKASITEMNKIKDQLNVNIKEEADLLDKLNSKIDENTNFLRATGSEEDKRILNIGKYKESMIQAIETTGLLNDENRTAIQVFSAMSLPFKELKKDFSDGISLMKNSAKETEGMSLAQKGYTVATNIATGATKIFTLALAATGIGLIIALVVLLIGYLKTFDPIIDKVEQVFAGLGAAVRVVQQVIMSFISSLSDMKEFAKNLGDFFSDPIGSIEKLGDKMVKAAQDAAKLKEAQQDLADQQAIQSVANKRQQAEIDRLILQSKDRTKSEEDRIALLSKAEKISQENFKKSAALADEEYRQAVEASRIKGQLNDEEVARLKQKGVEYAIYLLNIGKITQEEVDLITKAEEAKIDIYARSTSEQEKIINRQNALIEKAQAEAEARQKKAEEARKKALQDAAVLAKAELDLFISQQGYRAKSLEEELKIAEQVRDKKLKIAQAEYNASAKSKADELKLLTAQNEAREELLAKQANAVVTFSERELTAFIDANKSKIDANKFFSEMLLQEEESRLNSILEMQKNFEKVKLEQGIISEREYQDNIKVIQDEYQAKKDEAEQLRKEAEAERKAIDLENQRAYEDTVFQENLEIALGRLEQQRLQEIANSEKTGASIDLINKKYAAAKAKLDSEGRIAQIENAQRAIGDISTLMNGFFGENKLLSAALATTDMFLSIEKAYLSQLIPGDPTSVIRAEIAALRAGAFGALNVTRILGVKKLSLGGVLDGPSHDDGGIPITFGGVQGYEAEGDEIVLTKGVYRNPLLRRIASLLNYAGGGKMLASGGVLSNSVTNSSINQSIGRITVDIDYNRMAQANASIPTPVLPVEAFHTANDTYSKTIKFAEHG